MATKQAEYLNGADGYNAMVEDITSVFDWDEIEAAEGGSDTLFKKNCGDGTYAGLRVTKMTNTPPQIFTLANNGSTTYGLTLNSGTYYTARYVAYAYGDGFFAMCVSPNSLPNSSIYTTYAGMSTCTNIQTGEIGYCSFSVANTVCLWSKNVKSNSTATLGLVQNALIGAGVSIHNPFTYDVSDKVLVLTAIPDANSACLEQVTFNGISYTRLGRILVPAENTGTILNPTV